MSPRRKPPRRSGPVEAIPDEDDGVDRLSARIHGYDRLETGPDGREWAVRAVTGQTAVKTYRCPGCDQEIRSGLPHIVAWPADDYLQDIHDRRHWHTPCWAARSRRRR